MVTNVTLNREIDLLGRVGRDVTAELKRMSSTNGGEYASPCPWCGGRDRFRVWPNADPVPRFWCRQCERNGDAITYVMERDGLTYREIADKYGSGNGGHSNNHTHAHKPTRAQTVSQIGRAHV